MSNAFVAISNEHTFPVVTFLSAGLVNFFVPSGGGQWAVQAPIRMPAGAALGIAGLGARDIMGFCIIDLIYTGVIIALGLAFL